MLATESYAACAGGVRLVLPLRVGARLDTIELEPAHLGWLVRTATHVAVRDGLLGISEDAFATVRPGAIKTRHGGIACLDTLAIEIHDDRGRVVARQEFPRGVLEPYVTARAIHRAVESNEKGDVGFASSLHAIESDEPPWPVRVPPFPAWSVDDLLARAVAHGEPARGWIVTFVTEDVLDGLAALEAASRARRIEAAARIHARVGFDRRRRAFVRMLERLVITRDAVATGSTIVSSGASWGEFLAATPSDAPSVASHAHTHLHLTDAGDRGDPETGLARDATPMISPSDRVTHLTTAPDSLSAQMIASLYPDRRVVTLYGYQPDGTLAAERGWWVLPRGDGRTNP